MWSRRGLAVRTGRETKFRELEEHLLDPATRRSREQLEALVHPDFVGLGSSGGVYHRQVMVDTISGETTTEGVVIADFDTHAISEDTVLVTYRSIGGAGDETRRSSLWVETESGWQLRFHQGTRTPNTWGHIS